VSKVAVGILETEEIFPSVTVAAVELGISQSALNKHLNGNRAIKNKSSLDWLDGLTFYRVTENICRKCKVVLDGTNWHKCHRNQNYKICKQCYYGTSFERTKRYRRENWLKYKASNFSSCQPGKVSETEITDLFISQKGKCNLCNEELDYSCHLDHIIPKTKGGKTEISNLQFLCRMCNLGKNNYTDEEYIVHCKKVAEANCDRKVRVQNM